MPIERRRVLPEKSIPKLA